jgi:L-rhamnose mutarotase
MGRACFLLQVKKDRLEEYKEHHEAAWPEMLDALRETGWHNYSLFLRDDGLLIGYVETTPPVVTLATSGLSASSISRASQNAGATAEARERFNDSVHAKAGARSGLRVRRGGSCAGRRGYAAHPPMASLSGSMPSRSMSLPIRSCGLALALK